MGSLIQPSIGIALSGFLCQKLEPFRIFIADEGRGEGLYLREKYSSTDCYPKSSPDSNPAPRYSNP